MSIVDLQVDFLQQANHELEGKLQSSEEAGAELRQQVQELSSKNSRICSELQEIGDLVKQMEAEKQGSEESLKSRITRLEVSLFGSVFLHIDRMCTQNSVTLHGHTFAPVST